MNQKRAKLPAHFRMTMHQWRVLKRHDLRRAIESLDALRLGCAYTPTAGRIPRAMKLLEECKDLMSQKNWGR